MAKQTVLISLLTRQETSETEFGIRFLRLLFSWEKLAPEYASNIEPIDHAVHDIQGTLQFWNQRTFLWKRKRAIKSEGYFGHTSAFGAGAVQIEFAYHPSVDWKTFFNELVCECDAYYGYLHLITETELGDPGLPEDVAYDFFLGAFDRTVKAGFANLGWLNFFGDELANEVDLNFMNKHQFPVCKINDGFIVTVTDRLTDVLTNYEHFAERRNLLKGSFRKGLFRGTSE